MKNAPPEPVKAGKPSEDQGVHGGFGPDRSLLIVDDDNTFLTRLCRSMETRGFTVTAAHSVAEGLMAIGEGAPAFAVIDMRLADGNGLDVIRELKAKRP
ncbi:MAG TPA: response regulator, partial [Methylocella sp.]|nr:response regulator [Methylocella sp.]